MIRKYVFIGLIYVFVSNFSNHCYALTPDQVIKLKKAGVSDKTIQMMLQQEKEAKEAKEANPYDQIGMREIKDKDGNVVTIYSTGRSTKESTSDSEEEKVDKAWKMLQNMIIDKRK
ncbi:MAG TPA: hypothetical protein VMT12_03975 [Syntrophales bacterium]|nr:hypothetical protein [Syntrophales bacterium]